MSLYNLTLEKKKINEAQKRLNDLYIKIPATQGCLENIKKDGGCKAWCCETQNPQLLYVEFLNTWNYICKNFTVMQMQSIVKMSLHRYLFPAEKNGCVFFDQDNKTCKQHESRPYNCRIYGITPDEEFRPRFDRLKVIYPEIRYQCNLVETKNKEIVSKKNIDNWWLELKSIEMFLGIKSNLIHDDVGGSYRNFHDHILLHILGEEGLEYLTYYRLHGSESEKNIVIEKTIKNFSKFFEQSTDAK